MEPEVEMEPEGEKNEKQTVGGFPRPKGKEAEKKKLSKGPKSVFTDWKISGHIRKRGSRKRKRLEGENEDRK